jgi:hypothetical protein
VLERDINSLNPESKEEEQYRVLINLTNRLSSELKNHGRGF